MLRKASEAFPLLPVPVKPRPEPFLSPFGCDDSRKMPANSGESSESGQRAGNREE